ncbi:DNA-protecting protein DprA [Carnobacterium divergens]|uniref:DNA-processing protein DprA n=1 Tax=Carnobacterium divergens TaxID=2748 RepID=UPI0007F43EE7|nr:DNA-processing protein DprA [Carnobacterium divergens]MCO6017766.1 DNA-processing protein DprA [Carnobacterium divergens]MPQ21365.1 DNA-protecting protein DprA [Carnobacterium divergens]TFI60816.1 DNA-protecting protein DprA [Carnobacterium divergens]TFI70546.1 DNA-protecting protein DprA [Carnobacterium divergens]TFI87839.1 DNA-protecting protein DprA [Carnobacterium divergens]
MNLTELNEWLFHLAHCQGVGASSRIRMIAELIDNPSLSLFDLAFTTNLSTKNTKLFYESYEKIDRQAALNHYKEKKINWITILDSDYPSFLKEIYNPPALLFYQGDKTLLKERLLAIVGSRLKTAYGSAVLNALLPKLIQQQVVTVSGLAKGIDAEVHEKTIHLQGKTIGIIGTGLDLVYPKINKDLQCEIAKNHLLLSEYPIGAQPKRHHFPLRNRIIAGISLGTLVVEARKRSGSLITANLALQEGREVFSVPGSILSSYSKGTNELLLNGAKCVVDADQILEDL